MLIRMSLGFSELLSGLAARMRREDGQTMAEYALLLSLIIVVTAVVLLVWLRRDQLRARRNRESLLASCQSLLCSPQLMPRPGTVSRLTGRYGGYAVTLSAVVESLAPRKLPSLWLFVDVTAERPGRATLDMLLRPLGVEFWSPSDLPYRLEVPQSWPQSLLIRTDDAARVPPLEALEDTGRLLHNPRAKEVTIGPRGVRIVWQASEGARREYLLLRQAKFDVAKIDPALARGLLDHAVRLAEMSCDQRRAA
jgi:hypothetical protein